MQKNLKNDLHDRFLTFESLNGALVFIPWGGGFIYCGLYNQAFGYKYGMVSLGIVLVVWGLRKATVNRVKQAAILNARMKAVIVETPPVTPPVVVK